MFEISWELLFIILICRHIDITGARDRKPTAFELPRKRRRG